MDLDVITPSSISANTTNSFLCESNKSFFAGIVGDSNKAIWASCAFAAYPYAFPIVKNAPPNEDPLVLWETIPAPISALGFAPKDSICGSAFPYGVKGRGFGLWPVCPKRPPTSELCTTVVAVNRALAGWALTIIIFGTLGSVGSVYFCCRGALSRAHCLSFFCCSCSGGGVGVGGSGSSKYSAFSGGGEDGSAGGLKGEMDGDEMEIGEMELVNLEGGGHGRSTKCE